MTTSIERITIRPLDRTGAAHAVDTIFAALSPQSRYLRFHSPIPRLVRSVRDQLIDLDGRRRAAVVAEVAGPDGPVPVGIARIVGDGGGTADVAIAVADAWHRHGVGRRLLVAVGELAGEIGYTQLRGSVLPHNVAMLALTRDAFPLSRHHFDGDTVELLIPVGAGTWTVTHEDLLGDLVGPSVRFA
jgi:GNAT superfamily N-acetyltransferase